MSVTPEGHVLFTLDGKEYWSQEGSNLLEALREVAGTHQGQIGGFCYHPLFESSQKCLLCLVYDEKKGSLVQACKEDLNQGGSYLLNLDKVKEAKRELNEIYYQKHHFHCTNCENRGSCDFYENFGGGYPRTSLPKSKAFLDNERPYLFNLTADISLNLKECLHCSLCSDFEKSVSPHPALVLEEEGLEVKGNLEHNLGINLIDICPTGCFSDRRTPPLKANEIQQDFCRGCDRLCRVDVHLAAGASGVRPFRLSAPRTMAHLLCDEANQSFKEKARVPLMSLLKKKEGQWLPGHEEDLPSLTLEKVSKLYEGSWHLFLPANLPDDIWKYLLGVVKSHRGACRLTFFEWANRSQEQGLLRVNRNFKQKLKEELKYVAEEVPWHGIEEYLQNHKNDSFNNALLIAPESIKGPELWKKVLNVLQGFSFKAFAGPGVEHDIFDKVDLLIPLPEYHTLSWSGENFQGEVLHNLVPTTIRPSGDEQEIRIFKEKAR